MRDASMEAELLDWKCRGFNPPAFGTHTIRSSSETSVCSAAQRLTSTSTECLAPYGYFPATTSPNASVTFGCYLGNICCGFRLPQSSVFQPNAILNNENVLVNGEPAKKAIDMTVYISSTQHYCDTSCGLKEFGFSQGYTGLYPRISGYIDLPLVQRAVTTDLRYETCLQMEDHQQQWDRSNNWNSQLNYSKDQAKSPHIWKSSLTEGTATSFYQRGRKKRAPYTKLQLRELEREYTNTKFITNEKRRQIASSTNLSERQVTIWFQNRRVKDKKIIHKVCK